MNERAGRNDDVVVKIMDQSDWEAAERTGSYAGSAHDVRDGFIHLSTPGQLAGTLEKHYADKENLVAIAFLAGDLGGDLKWEVSRGGALFPHLYCALPCGRARAVVKIERAPDGRFLIPDLVIS